MRIRFGYVSHALSLYEATPAKTMTFARYQKLDPDTQVQELERITERNLQNTIRNLHFNVAHELPLYRFSSSIAPLATHDEVPWDYITPFQSLYEEIGSIVRRHRLRTSFHPNQFTLFTSDKPHVTANAVKDLEYHYAMLQAMDLHEESHINIHVGGAYGDKEKAVARFHENLKQLPEPIKKQLTLENDDKTYTTTETLEVCEKEAIPMMFDYHHYMANHTEEESLETLLPRFFKTWDHMPVPPKIHISSPKNEKEYRSHAGSVDLDFIRPLLKELKSQGEPVDFMIEAKDKDHAVLKLIEDIAGIRGAKRVAGGEIEY
ncbi:UV DNA damage repair endonuclease UvsE [Halobacillus litoralis]|uniref:UV DNA damage repair endonuclease UvsE n=1 Tax=Halobacillus litoralis TaxID=45668 RepID=UPI001CD637F0|nr:UV DNA damage repair endonuclease UvsE [Halobacillus litoralis]MCA0972445.1 UV DNA damage repair endonuclease UvsE [Halobacillus litoralis]